MAVPNGSDLTSDLAPVRTLPVADFSGDFDVPSSREDVDRDSSWNQWLRNEIHTLFIEAFDIFRVCFYPFCIFHFLHWGLWHLQGMFLPILYLPLFVHDQFLVCFQGYAPQRASEAYPVCLTFCSLWPSPHQFGGHMDLVVALAVHVFNVISVHFRFTWSWKGFSCYCLIIYSSWGDQHMLRLSQSSRTVQKPFLTEVDIIGVCHPEFEVLSHQPLLF